MDDILKTSSIRTRLVYKIREYASIGVFTLAREMMARYMNNMNMYIKKTRGDRQIIIS